jgi:hypothetical protein
LTRCKLRERDTVALYEHRVEPAPPDEQLDQSRVRLRHGERMGPVDQHPNFHARETQPCRHE